MIKERSKIIMPAAILVLALIFMVQLAQADWSISFSGEYRSPYHGHQLGDRITSEYRRGYQVDDWIERGSSSVTDSPIFSDGIRLAAWATRYGDDYDYALASTIYFFELPHRARSVKIKISYDGEADRNAFNDDIAGRVWIRRARMGSDYEEYYPSEGRYEDMDEPLYGDTFILRSRKNYEIIRLSADDYDIDGMMELHVVVEGKQRIDVKYIEVETYTSLSSFRVITRYSRDYEWQPWYNYTYWYFYTGPIYHFGDYYYVRYTYPRYRHYYVDIRRRYNSYLRVYYIKHPRRRVHWSHVNYVHRGKHRTWDRSRLSRWTPDHEETRKRYVITSTKERRPVEIRQSRTRIRSVLSSHRRSSPAEIRSRSRATVETTTRRTGSSSVRTRSSTGRKIRPSRSPLRVETPDRTGSQRDVRSSVRTRSSSSSQSSRGSSVRRAPTRTRTQESESTRKQRESVKSRSSTQNRNSSNVRKAPSRSTTRRQSSSRERKVETKKDEDDEDDDEKKSRSSRSSRSSQSSSRKTRRTRTR